MRTLLCVLLALALHSVEAHAAAVATKVPVIPVSTTLSITIHPGGGNVGPSAQGGGSVSLTSVFGASDNYGVYTVTPNVTLHGVGGDIVLDGDAVFTPPLPFGNPFADFLASAQASYSVPDPGEALVPLLAIACGAALTNQFAGATALSSTVTLYSETLGQSAGISGSLGLPIGSFKCGPGTSSGSQIFELPAGDTVEIVVETKATLGLGTTSFSGPVLSLRSITAAPAQPPTLACQADLNGDGVVNAVDLSRLKSVFFQRCTP